MEKELYTNTKYNFEREGSKTIILDVPMNTSDHSFTKILQEKLTVDVHSEIFLDSITTYDCKSSFGSSNDIGFILTIDQFDVKSTSNIGILGRSVFIPNEQNVDSNAESTALSKSHKGKKLNYVCSINPTNIDRISGKLTNIAGASAFASNNGRFVAEFVIVSK